MVLEQSLLWRPDTTLVFCKSKSIQWTQGCVVYSYWVHSRLKTKRVYELAHDHWGGNMANRQVLSGMRQEPWHTWALYSISTGKLVYEIIESQRLALRGMASGAEEKAGLPLTGGLCYLNKLHSKMLLGL